MDFVVFGLYNLVYFYVIKQMYLKGEEIFVVNNIYQIYMLTIFYNICEHIKISVEMFEQKLQMWS